MLSSVSRSVLRQARPQLRTLSLSQLQRLLSTLTVLELNNGKLNAGSLSAVTAAKKLGGPIAAFVAGGNIKSVAEEAAKVEGVEKVISVDNAAYDKVCAHAHTHTRLFPGPPSSTSYLHATMKGSLRKPTKIIPYRY